MNYLFNLFLAPFQDFIFMRHALVACMALALGCGPVGVLLVLKRMSLVGDALSHAVLPGVAVGFLISGLSLYAMTLGGIVAGLAVALVAGAVARFTLLREDASFAAIYLMSLAMGVLIVSLRGSNIDLIHVLFGTILAVDDADLVLVASITSVTLFTLAIIYRPLIVECFDPGYLRSVAGRGTAMHFTFLVLVVLNLVAGFRALGTLMAVGLMMVPAASARFWQERPGPWLWWPWSSPCCPAMPACCFPIMSTCLPDLRSSSLRAFTTFSPSSSEYTVVSIAVAK